MLKVDVITLLPQMFDALNYGINHRAKLQNYIDLRLINPRDFTTDKHRTVDDKTYGGGPGMLMKYQPLRDAIEYAKGGSIDHQVIYMSPQGRQLKHRHILRLSQQQHLILLCGRYEGIDERLLQCCVDEEWSLGDFVLSGGELAAMVLIDAMIRLIPGTLGDAQSAEYDSFYHGLLDYPQYTRPEVVDGMRVPEVLLSGDHKKITAWRQYQALKNTWLKRPDLIDEQALDQQQLQLLKQIKAGKEFDV